MYSIHSQSAISVKKNISQDRNQQMDEEELKEMQLNWNAVEQKRDEIVSRINSLARKFPEGAYDLLEDTAKPSENEQEFVQIVSNKKNLKDQGLEFDYKKSRLNVITVKERKNNRDAHKIAMVTNRIENIRHVTYQHKEELANKSQNHNAHSEYLHEYGQQMRDDQKRAIQDAQERILEGKIEKFYMRKSDSVVNAKVILQHKQKAEMERLKKAQNIKFQTDLARIRCDINLKNRQEKINSRLVNDAKRYKEANFKRKKQISEVEKKSELALVRWTNSSVNQNEAQQQYSSLFDADKYIEVGGIPNRPVKDETMIQSFTKDFRATKLGSGENSTMGNTYKSKNSFKINLHHRKNSFFEKTQGQSNKEESKNLVIAPME